MRPLITGAFGIALLAGGCAPEIESDWKRIDELDARVGTIGSFEDLGGVERRSALPSPASEEAAVARVENLLSLMSTGQPRDISLAEVRRSTIENNLQIQSTLVMPEIAAQELRAERAKFQSTFVASVQQSRVVSPSSGIGPLVGVESDAFTAVPGLEVPLRGGGTVTLDWTVSTSDVQADGQDLPTAQSRPRISLQQPLLEGAGLEYNEASIVLAAADLGVARAEAQASVINQVIQADVAYWQLHLAWSLLQIDLDLYRTSRDLLVEQRRLVAVGASSIANVYNFETLVASAVDRVIQSELQVRRSVRAVKVVMQDSSITLDGSVALTPISKLRLVGFDFDLHHLVERAITNRADLLELEFQQLSSAVEMMLRRNEMLPQLDLVAAWNANGFQRGQSIGSASRDIFDGERDPGWSIGVSARVSLGNEAAIANYQAAVLQRLKTVADRRQQEILVTQEVLDAIDAIEAGWNTILTAELQVRAAGRFYDAYETLFKRGQIPSSNLTQALQSLNQAKIQKLSAEVDYQISLNGLAQATGCLLGHAGVDWKDEFQRDRLENLPSLDVLEGLSTDDRNPLEEGAPSLQDMIDAEAGSRSRSGSSRESTPGADRDPGADGDAP